MANIFYDRSGKPHVIGQKKNKNAEDEEVKDKKQHTTKGHVKKPHAHKEQEHKAPSRDHKASSRGSFQVNPERHSEKTVPARSGEPHSKKSKRRGRPEARPYPGDKKHGDRKNKANPRNNPSAKRFEKRSGSTKGKTPQNPPDWIKLKGVVDKNKRGSAFLVFDRSDIEDIFIPRYYVDQLFHGDRVEAVLSEGGRDEYQIEDIKVLEHRFKEIFGRVMLNKDGPKSKAHSGYLVYERKKAKEEVWIPSLPANIKEGDWVKAEVIFAEKGAAKSAPIAKIIEVIGQELPAIFDIQMVAGEFNLKEHHSFEAVKQAENYKLELDDPNRTDLRHIPFMTIDGERARDFDDAVYVEPVGQGYRLWVAIADVSHYVKEGTPLDREAYERGTSVYFPERAFHMLPRALSEELCSLKPNVPRLSMAVSIDYSAEGTKGEIKLFNAIIESRRRATYTEIQAEKDDPKHATLFALYRILRKQRNDRGSIDFDFPEAEIILDEKTGEPSDIITRERQDSNRLIEEFMIAANESVSEWMVERRLPFIFRVHEDPSPESIEKFKKLARAMGVAFASKGGVPKPIVLAEFIRTLQGHPAEPVLANGLLRSMRQAIYTSTHNQHYGLASEAYTHFTSPIRRYPDLVVHRLLRAALAKEKPADEETLEQIAEHCSYRERVASEAERESIRFKQVRLMAKNLGKEFEGKVSGLSERGMFIQLDHPYCEGMVPVDLMKDDWYEFNEERMILSGKKKKRTFQVGTKVKICVTRVDLDARQVEFQLL